MRVIVHRGAAAVAFLAACILMLQVADSTGVSPVVAVASPLLKQVAPFKITAGREFYITNKRWIPFGRSAISVPILMYHYVRPQPSIVRDRVGYNLSVSPETFQIQMDWLSTHGYHPIDFNDLRAYFAGEKPLPDKPVVITLDDGYRDLYSTAFPILQAHSFKAVAYIVTSFVGQSRYVTSAQVREMDRSGIQIASHTVDHADLARASAGQAVFQLATSKAWLQGLLGHPVVDFAYPSGKFSAQVVAALQATGYDTAVTETFGTVHSRADRYLWTRVRVGGGESMADFIHNLGPEESSLVLATVTTGREAGTGGS